MRHGSRRGHARRERRQCAGAGWDHWLGRGRHGHGGELEGIVPGGNSARLNNAAWRRGFRRGGNGRLGDGFITDALVQDLPHVLHGLFHFPTEDLLVLHVLHDDFLHERVLHRVHDLLGIGRLVAFERHPHHLGAILPGHEQFLVEELDRVLLGLDGRQVLDVAERRGQDELALDERGGRLQIGHEVGAGLFAVVPLRRPWPARSNLEQRVRLELAREQLPRRVSPRTAQERPQKTILSQ